MDSTNGRGLALLVPAIELLCSWSFLDCPNMRRLPRLRNPIRDNEQEKYMRKYGLIMKLLNRFHTKIYLIFTRILNCYISGIKKNVLNESAHKITLRDFFID